MAEILQRYKVGLRSCTTEVKLEIKWILRKNDDDEDGINIQPNYITLKSRVILADDYKMDFTVKNEWVERYIGWDLIKSTWEMVKSAIAQDKSTSPISTRY